MWDRITAISALGVAGISLWVSITEMRENQTSRRINVQPNADVGVNKNQQNGYEVSLYNRGLGPAEVKWFKAFLDLEEVDDWDNLYERLGLNNNGYELFSIVYPGTYLPATAETRKVLLAEREPELASSLWASENRVSYLVCFCSMYGDCKIESEVRDIDRLLEALADKVPSCDADMDYPVYFSMPPSFISSN